MKCFIFKGHTVSPLKVNVIMWKWKWLSHVQVCDPMDYSPWNSPGQNTGVGSLSLLQGIFPTKGLNPGLLHCRRILYQLSHKGNPRILEWVAFPFSRRSSNPGMEPRSPALQVDSLPAEPQGKPKNIGVDSLSLLQGIFLTQELNWRLLPDKNNCRNKAGEIWRD